MSTSATSSASTSGATLVNGTLRMSGLVSGLDTTSIVKSLMQVDQAKYDKLAQQKTTMDWTSDANLAINTQLKAFRDSYLSVLSSSTSVLSSSAILAFKVTSDTTSSIKLSANSEAVAGTHVINSITSLAAGATAKSSAQLSSTSLVASSSLSELAKSIPLTFGTDGTLAFKINGESFSFTSSDTLQSVINTVSSDTTANVSMNYSSLTGKITLASKTLGSTSSLKIENVSGNAFADSNAAFGIAQGTFTNGTDAKINIDGVDVTKSTNSFSIDGVVYSLKNTTSTPINFSVDQDVDGAVDKIKGFITAYNTLIDSLQSKVDEAADSDYPPLTDAQKSQMSETQISQWEAKAKTGILSDNTYITKLLNDMRGAFYDKVTSAGTNAVSIGLTTISYMTKGDITVDETKLRAALENNPQEVAQIISGVSYDTNTSAQYAKSGVASRISTTLNNYLGDYSGYRTTSNTTKYNTLTEDMTSMETQITQKQDRYWTQFTAMETALSKLNSQSSWLSQQFSSSSNG